MNTQPLRRVGRDLRQDVRRLPYNLGVFVAGAISELFVTPYREGRPRLQHRTPAMRTVFVITFLAYALSIALLLASGSLRAHGELSVVVGNTVLSFPRATLWAILSLLGLSLALLQSGGLHAPKWLRIATLVVTSCALLFVGTLNSGPQGTLTRSLVVALIGAAALIALQVVVWRRPAPAWWEFCAVLAVVTVCTSVAYRQLTERTAGLGSDPLPLVTVQLMQLLGQFAVPMAVTAGTAVADVALSTARWLTDFARTRWSTTLLTCAVVLLAGWRAVDAIRAVNANWSDDSGNALHSLLGALALAGCVAATWTLLHRRVRRVATADGEQPLLTTKDVTDEVSTVALPTALVLTITLIPTVMLLFGQRIIDALAPASPLADPLGRVAEWATDDTTLLVTRVLGGVALVAAGRVLARRNRMGAALLAAITGTVILARLAVAPGAVLDSLRLDAWSLDVVGLVVVLGLVARWAAQRTLTTERLGPLALLLLLSALFAERDFVSDPLSAFLGFAGIAFVLFGFVWNFLTAAGDCNDDSAKYPTDTRLLLFCAQSLFGMIVLAWMALTRDVGSGLDLGAFADLGDSSIGLALLLSAFVTLLANAHAPASAPVSAPASAPASTPATAPAATD